MPKPTKKELLAAMKDPDLLREAGLQPIVDEDEKELFSDIVLGDNDTMEDLVRKMNERAQKQRKYLQSREKKILKAAEDKASEGERTRQEQEVDSFLKDHPELSNNKELLDLVEPLYHNGKSLEDAWKIGCKSLDLDPTTGKAPEGEKKEEKEESGDEKDKGEKKEKKKSAVRTDTQDDGLPGSSSDDDSKESKPRTIREIASDISNNMAAKGKNPFRDS